jgi:hypothetical protein
LSVNGRKQAKIRVVQRWRKGDTWTLERANKTRKGGKEYWVEIIPQVWGCRRSAGRWAFKHECIRAGFKYFEIRKGRGHDRFSRCCLCAKKFPPRRELEETASSLYPDLKTIKFLAKLIGYDEN